MKDSNFWLIAKEIHESLSLKDLTTLEIRKTLKKKKDAPYGKLINFYGGADNGYVARVVLKVFIQKVFEKVIEGGIFVFPLKTRPHIYAKALGKESVEKARQNGKYSFINLRKTNYNIYTLKYSFGPYVAKHDYDIVVSKGLYAKFVQNQNKGVTYPRMIKKRNVIRNTGYTKRGI